jgi:hypothetical protein
LDPILGTWAKVMKIVSAAALLVVVVAGCGGANRPQRTATPGVPRALAHEWEGRASAIAAAAAAGNDCRAMRLAASLRTDVLAAEGRVPARLRTALSTGVNELADLTTCTPVVQEPPKAPKPGPKPPKHGPPGHDKHGDGNEQ